MERFVRQNEGSLLAVACAAAAFLFLLGMCVALMAGEPAHEFPEPEYVLHRHVVQPGETLWGIAKQYRPNEDPRKVVYEIQEASGVDGGLIRAYQLVLVPVRREDG
jgi:hypothetical protein